MKNQNEGEKFLDFKDTGKMFLELACNLKDEERCCIQGETFDR